MQLKRAFKWVWLSGVVLMGGFACSLTPGGSGQEDEVLAQVYDQVLYMSELEGMFPVTSTAEDSQNIIKAYANRWIQDAVLIHEAQENLPEDLDLEKLVDNYRSSLLRHSFEEKLISEKMDSVVTEDQLRAFYEKNKEQYQLETPIIRCYFVKIPQPVPNISDLRRMWNDVEDPDQLEALIQYCSQYAEAHILEDSSWYRMDDISFQLPKGTLTRGNVGNRRILSLANDNHQFFLRIFEHKMDKEISPLSFIQDQARRAILHNRRVDFLEVQKRELFEEEIKRGAIRTYF